MAVNKKRKTFYQGAFKEMKIRVRAVYEMIAKCAASQKRWNNVNVKRDFDIPAWEKSDIFVTYLQYETQRFEYREGSHICSTIFKNLNSVMCFDVFYPVWGFHFDLLHFFFQLLTMLDHSMILSKNWNELVSTTNS